MLKNLLRVFVFMVCLSVSLGYADTTIVINPPPPPQEPAVAEVEEVGPPPVEAEPPEMVVVPSGGQSVYLVPGRAGLYFHGEDYGTGFGEEPGIVLLFLGHLGQ